ncbi:MAG: T9SS type B sorting domain-containing protein [Bacteroidia bacterium]
MKIKTPVAFFLFVLLCSFSVKAQQGKDGVASITTTSIVNIYTSLTANVSAGATSITVASTVGFSVGDLIYIIQMQGATVRDSIYEWGNVNDAIPRDTSYGKIRTYNGSGNNEFGEITSILGNIVTLDCALKDSFGINGKTQIIRVPRYTSLNLSGLGQITCPAWNGVTGGVVVIEVQGNTSIGSGTSINVAGMGFRGGSVLNATGYGVTNTGANYGSPSTNGGAHKGESIAGDTNVYKLYNYVNNYSSSTPLATCKGNVANGGGGGNAMNCGGGGGSNGGAINNWNGMGNADVSTANNIASWNQESTVPLNGSFRPTTSSGGGRGGYAFSGTNADPTTNGPGNAGTWSGDGRHNDGGWGGIPLDYSSGKIFLGGGGGAGDSNDEYGTSGGNGGGIVYLVSYGTVSGAGQIIADGATAANTINTGASFNNCAGVDGAGGGGGGGGVFISSTSNITLTNTLAISAQGGIGGNYQCGCNFATTSQNYGPGGGGGGGYVATTNTVTGINVNGGANGIVVNSGGNTSLISTKFPPNGSTSGGAGTITTFTPTFYLTASNYTTCTSSAISLSVTVNGTTPSGLSVNWYTVATGGTPVYSGNPYNITAPATAGTYTYYAGTCPGMYRIPIIVTVTSTGGPVLTVNATNTIICSGVSDTLSVSGATSYTWSANAGSATTSTVLINPTSSTVYTVTGTTTGACAGTSTASISITVNPAPTITITPTTNTLCSGASATLTASGATSYTWSANAGSATTSTVVVTPTVTTIYTITGTASGCTGTKTSTVTVNPTPTVSVNSPSSCGGGTDTLTATGSTTYAWSTSATTASITVTPTVTTTYTVTGTTGNCSSTAIATVTTVSNPSVMVTPSSNPICAGNTATLTATGASTYTWTPSATLSSATGGTVTATPSVTTTYTVSGNVGTCTATPMVITLTVNPAPSFSVSNSNPVFCQGDSSHLSVVSSNTVAATYTWSPSGTLNSTFGATVTATPTATTVYTVNATATSGGCASLPQTTTVTVHPITTLSITPSATTICSGGTTTLTTSNSLQVYTWLPAAALSGATNTATVTATPSVTTTFSVTGQDAFGCRYDTATALVTVITLTTSATSNSPVCAGSSITLSGNSASGSTYSWSGPNSYASTSTTSSVSINNATTINGGVYTLTVSVGACSATSTVNVTVNPIPTVTVSSPAIPNCAGISTTLTASGANTYTWSPSTGLSTTTGSLTIATPTIVTTYTVIGTANGCSSIPQVYTVTVHTLPHVFITPSATTVCSGSTTTLTAGSGMQFYTWLPSNTSGATLLVNPTTTTVYSVTGIDFLGCFSDTAIATVNVIACATYSINIPNVFSPNGDGINEVFDVKATGITSLTCDIYDRWGLKLYTFTNVNEYWDGSAKSGKAPDGTYFYVIQTSDIKGEAHKYNGFLELIR